MIRSLLRFVRARMPYAFVPAIVFLGLSIALNPRILTPRGLNNLSLQVAALILVTMGQTLVVLVRELDMSVGAQIGLATVIIGSTTERLGAGSIGLALLAAVGCGFACGAIVVWMRIPGIVVTLAASMIIGGMALVIMPQSGGDVHPALGSLITGRPYGVPNSALLVLAVLLVWKYFKETPLGHSIYAVGGNPYSAFASGLSVTRAKLAAYAGSGLLAGIAGIVVAGKTMTGDALIGEPYTLTSIASTVLGGASFLGGVGTMRGAAAGAIVMAVLVNIMFFLGVSTMYQYVAEGIILLVAVIVGVLNQLEARGTPE
jgi:ribose transport system permease protein